MYKMNSDSNQGQDKQMEDKLSSISLEKSGNKWMFFMEEKKNYQTLIEILKKYCILSHFSSDYDIIQILGKGHFAEVFSVRKKSTNQLFAAKIFRKDSDIFQKSKVFHIKSIKKKHFFSRLYLFKK